MFNIFAAESLMNTGTKSTIALNERRRLAVKLRLEGRKLKDISDLVDLSSPTIIAAHKQFLKGGWEAVDVKQRGRPAGEQTAPAAALEELIASAFDKPANSNSPWTLALLNELATSLGIQTASRTIGTYIEKHGLVEPSLYKLCKSKGLQTDWLNTSYKTIGDEAKKQNATVFWAGSASCQTNKGVQKFIYAHSTRGKYFWLAGDHTSDSERFIDFFNRLKQQSAHSRVAVVWKGHDPKSTADINHWLNQSPEVAFYLHPDSKAGNHSEIEVAPSQTSKHPATNSKVKTDNSDKTDEDVKQNSSTQTLSKTIKSNERSPTTMSLTHLQRLEAESIHIMREVIAEADKPVMLYSIGKDSAVMLHLAKKAFYPAKPPFPLLHVDTGWKFQAMYDHRDKVVKDTGLQLIVHKNPEGIEKGVNPFTHGSALHTDIMKTQALKQALDKHEFDVAFGGARRDEEKSRAKERVLSFRTEQHSWDPKNQRPELWNLYNTKKKKGESIRAFPLSNWTELDIWQYINLENIPVVPLYFSAERPVVLRDGTWIMVDDDRMQMNEGEVPIMKKIRFRTLGCYPLTGAIESNATSVVDVIEEMLLSNSSERQGRMIDHDNSASMEKKKQEGYF